MVVDEILGHPADRPLVSWLVTLSSSGKKKMNLIKEDPSDHPEYRSDPVLKQVCGVSVSGFVAGRQIGNDRT